MAAAKPTHVHHLPPTGTVCLVLGGAGFIGSHCARALHAAGLRVIVADTHACAYLPAADICARFVAADLRSDDECARVFSAAAADGKPVWAFLFAADMGGMGFIASNEGTILLSNTAITANAVRHALRTGAQRLFVASSACVYPVGLQQGGATGAPPALREEDAWPAQPQDGYGLEKLYGEELAMRAAAGATLQVRVARFHNVYGPRGTWVGGREKAPAAFLRKALCLRDLDGAQPGHGLGVEVWGDGAQVRTFCYIDDAVRGALALMCSDVSTPVNIGSDEAVAIGELALLAGEAAGLGRADTARRLSLQPAGPVGVRARSADLSKAARLLGWEPRLPLAAGLRLTADWLEGELAQLRGSFADAAELRGFLASALTSPHAQRAETVR